jgi:hypothetical protein
MMMMVMVVGGGRRKIERSLATINETLWKYA